MNYTEIQQIRKTIDDKHTIEIFDSITDDYIYQLPSVADSHGRSILFVNPTEYQVILDLKGTETCNGYSTNVVLTEKGGWWMLISGKSDIDWKGITDGKSTIYYVESETADTGLALDGTWDDVSVDGGANPMTLLDGVYGKGILEAYGNQDGRDSSIVAYIDAYFGVGKTSGNNAPDIPKAYDYSNFIQTAANTLIAVDLSRKIKCSYESDGSPIYMKSKIESNEMNITTHTMRGVTNGPMGLYFKRTY
jgi:hypothetical protein